MATATMREQSNSPDRVQVRPATAADASELSALQRDTWRDAYRHIFPREFLESLDPPEDRWVEKITHGVSIEVATVGGGLAGYVSVAAGEFPGWGELRALYVHPSAQRCGLGSLLLEAGLETLRGRGFARAYLWVFEANLVARDFYGGRGWVLARPLRLEDIGRTQVALVRYDRDLREPRRPSRGRS